MQMQDTVLLTQLIDSLEASTNEMENSYNKNDKQGFEKSKKAVLDFQNKISFLLKK